MQSLSPSLVRTRASHVVPGCSHVQPYSSFTVCNRTPQRPTLVERHQMSAAPMTNPDRVHSTSRCSGVPHCCRRPPRNDWEPAWVLG
eukprot:4603213-Amphidinium_carterae.1